MTHTAHEWKKELGFEAEDSWASEAAGDAVEWQRFYEDDDIWFTREIIDLTGTEGTRDKVEHALGNFVTEGNTISNIEILADTCRTLFKCLFGGEAGANPYTYTPANTLSSMTIWKRAGEIYVAVIGCKVHALEFAFNLGTMKATAEIRARHPVYKTALTFPSPRTYSNKKPFMFWGIVVSYGGSNILVKEGTLRFDNALPDNDFYSGSPYTYEHAEGVRDIRGTMVITFDSVTQAQDFLSHPEKAMTITATSPHGDTLVWTLPRIVTEGGWRVSKSENLHRIERPWHAEAPTDGSDIITAVLTQI